MSGFLLELLAFALLILLGTPVVVFVLGTFILSIELAADFLFGCEDFWDRLRVRLWGRPD